MRKMRANELKYGLKYFWLNKIVNHVPCWAFRKKMYQLAGMKIGKSHILMNVIVDGWRRIEIRDGVCINEYCYLDGRGGLKIGDDVSVSTYCKIVSGEHDLNDSNFEFSSKPVLIQPRVWLGIGSIVLPGANLGEGCVIAAGAVAVGKEYNPFTVYGGVPAIRIAVRKNNLDYHLDGWTPYFR